MKNIFQKLPGIGIPLSRKLIALFCIICQCAFIVFLGSHYIERLTFSPWSIFIFEILAAGISSSIIICIVMYLLAHSIEIKELLKLCVKLLIGSTTIFFSLAIIEMSCRIHRYVWNEDLFMAIFGTGLSLSFCVYSARKFIHKYKRELDSEIPPSI